MRTINMAQLVFASVGLLPTALAASTAPLQLVEVATPIQALLLTALQWVDINGDHRPDLIVTGYSPPQNSNFAHVYLNLSNGFVEQASPIRPVVGGAMAVADIDSDGDPDLVVAGQTRTEFDVWQYKNVDGHFELDRQGWLTPLAFRSLNFGDVDSDGDPDLVFGSFAGIARNDGGTLLATDIAFSFYERGGTSNFCDVNSDGRLDIVQTGIATPNSITPGRLWLQNSKGGFLATNERFAIMSGPGAKIVPKDLNCDGRQDLFFGEPHRDSGSPPAIAYLQNSNGTFSDMGIGANNAGIATDGGLIDLRGDGTPDVVLTGYLSGTLLDPAATQLFEFIDGQYVRSSFVLPRFQQTTISAVDYDLDGDEDLFIIGEEPDPASIGSTIAGVRLFRNDTPQANARCPAGLVTSLQPVPLSSWAMLLLIFLMLTFAGAVGKRLES